jgi:hypothetical protein
MSLLNAMALGKSDDAVTISCHDFSEGQPKPDRQLLTGRDGQGRRALIEY